MFQAGEWFIRVVGELRYACSPGCSFNAASLVEAGGALRLIGRETSYNAASGGLFPIAFRILPVDAIPKSSSRAVVSMVMSKQLRIATASMSREIYQIIDSDGPLSHGPQVMTLRGWCGAQIV